MPHHSQQATFTVPDNKYAEISVPDATLVLSTETFELGRKTAFSTGSLLVYAETIRITGDLILPGKTIKIFCNRLELVNPVTIIDVSGLSGRRKPSQGTGAIKALDGDTGGNISICVENLLPDLIGNPYAPTPKGLLLKANGGDGQDGMGIVDDSDAGDAGDGGDGGLFSYMTAISDTF
jgi:hypothetical protein